MIGLALLILGLIGAAVVLRTILPRPISSVVGAIIGGLFSLVAILIVGGAVVMMSAMKGDQTDTFYWIVFAVALGGAFALHIIGRVLSTVMASGRKRNVQDAPTS